MTNLDVHIVAAIASVLASALCDAQSGSDTVRWCGSIPRSMRCLLARFKASRQGRSASNRRPVWVHRSAAISCHRHPANVIYKLTPQAGRRRSISNNAAKSRAPDIWPGRLQNKTAATAPIRSSRKFSMIGRPTPHPSTAMPC